MTGSVVEVGDKLHVITRRLFEEDVRRHFVGEVSAVSSGLVEARGYTFIFNPGVNEYRRLPELRTRLLSIADAGLIVNKIPRELDLSAIEYRIVQKRLVITDGAAFSLPINEFGASN